MTTDGTVLVVDDETVIADGYRSQLDDRYTVRTAYHGEDALEILDETVDVVLLDRDMPGLSGDEVLRHVRDQGLPCRVALVTGMKPSLDIVELGFDDYLCKPATREDLHETVEALLLRSTYSSRMREYFSLVSKRSVLLQNMDESELEGREEFATLNGNIDRLKRELDELLSQIDEEILFQSIDR